MLSTIYDVNDELIVGTFQDDSSIISSVFKNEEYTSNKINILGDRYLGVYIPLYDKDNNICGMIFSGVQDKVVKNTLNAILKIDIILTVAVSVIAILVLRAFAARLCQAIFHIEQYLGKVSNNELDLEMDQSVLDRKDEIGTLGRYSVDVSVKLMKLMNNDPLTDLYNRRSCESHFYNLQEIYKGEKENITVVLCDIDHFKNINDTYGHDTGDVVLVKVADILRKVCEKPGFAARWGGEEFILVLNKDINEAKTIIEKLRMDIKEQVFKTEQGTFQITMTYGVSACTTEDNIYKEIKIADEKLYDGKESGRDKIVY